MEPSEVQFFKEMADSLRSFIGPSNPGKTHSAGCWKYHHDCCLYLAADWFDGLAEDAE
jgi:hypothetical protein